MQYFIINTLGGQGYETTIKIYNRFATNRFINWMVKCDVDENVALLKIKCSQPFFNMILRGEL